MARSHVLAFPLPIERRQLNWRTERTLAGRSRRAAQLINQPTLTRYATRLVRRSTSTTAARPGSVQPPSRTKATGRLMAHQRESRSVALSGVMSSRMRPGRPVSPPVGSRRSSPRENRSNAQVDDAETSVVDPRVSPVDGSLASTLANGSRETMASADARWADGPSRPPRWRLSRPPSPERRAR